MITAEFLQKCITFIRNNIIEPDSRTDEYLLHFWNVTQFFQKFDIVSVIYFQIRTRLREQALAVLTQTKKVLLGMIGSLPEQAGVVDIAFEVLFLRNHLRLI